MKSLYRAIPPQVRKRLGSFLPNSFRRNIVFDLVDTFVISYPKAGRTWLRMLLGYIINEHYKLNLSHAELTEVHDITKNIVECQIIKFTHDSNPHLINFNKIKQPKKEYSSKNIIFLVRDPRDLLVSFHHHYVFRMKSENKEDLSLDELAFRDIGGIHNIINFYNSWIQGSSSVKRFELIRYEDLKYDSFQVLQRLLKMLDIHATPTVIEEAISFCSFENLKNLETEGKLNSKRYGTRNSNTSLKTRSGKVGSYKDKFTASVLENINVIISNNLDERFGYN